MGEMLMRVLVIRFSSLGDIIQTFPSIESLAASKHEVHYFTKAGFAPLVAANLSVAHVHTISDHASLSELYAKLRELRTLRFDLVLDLHRNLRSFFALLVLGSFW